MARLQMYNVALLCYSAGRLLSGIIMLPNNADTATWWSAIIDRI